MVKEVKASDARTVVFTLNNAFAPFETTIASPMFWIMPKEVIEADGDARKRVIGSGPFLFDRFEKGVQVVAKRNPDYYFVGTPYVDEVDLLIVPEDATAVANLRAKSIDINGLSPTDRNAVASTNPEIQLLEFDPRPPEDPGEHPTNLRRRGYNHLAFRVDDIEAATSHLITVQASDGTAITTTDFTIGVADVAPTLKAGNALGPVVENTTVVGDVDLAGGDTSSDNQCCGS